MTMYLNALNRHLTDEDTSEVKSFLEKVKTAFTEFKSAHFEYHDGLDNENDLTSSEGLFLSIQVIYILIVDDARAWLKKPSGGFKSCSGSNNLMTLLNAPKVEIDIFTGNPLDYSVFMSVFNELVGKTDLSAESKLTRLIQCTASEAKKAIKNCALVGGQVGYDQAIDLLKKRFGNPNLIARSVIDNLVSGKNVSPKDLAQLADNIQIAYTTLKKLSMLPEIDTQGSILSILQNCPHFVKAAWRRKTLKPKETSGENPNLEEFSKFMSRTASEVNVPVYSDEKYYTKNQYKSETQKPPHAALQATVSPPLQSKGANTPACIISNDESHKLYNCGKFKDMTPSERLKYVSRNNLCFNCFYSNHRAGNCRLKSMRDVTGCKYKHSKLLHMYEKLDKDNNEAKTLDMTNASGKVNNTMVYVPMVEVCTDNTVKSWALLDTGSTNPFITEKLAGQLNREGTPPHIKLARLIVRETNVQNWLTLK